MAGSCSAQIDALESVQTYINGELEELKKAIDKEKRENQANVDFCNRLTDDIGMIQKEVAQLQTDLKGLLNMCACNAIHQKAENEKLKQEVKWLRATVLQLQSYEKLCPPTVDTTTAVDTAATESTTAAVEECRYYYRYDGIC